MKKLLTIFAAIIITINVVDAQQAEYYFYSLDHTTPLKSVIYYQQLKNTSQQTGINVDSIVFAKISRHTTSYCRLINNDKSLNTWISKPLFSFTENKDEADVIVSGNYSIDKINSATEILKYESSSDFASPIPYFEVENINSVEVKVFTNYLYSDNSTFSDTTIITKKVIRNPKAEFKSIDELLVESQEDLISKIRSKYNIFDLNKHNYKFPKVKVGSNDLKTEYKNAKDLLKADDIMKLGNLYKRIYEDKKSKEAAYCLGICYELIGNYPKAQEYYKQMPDFHTKTRMKNSMILFDYLNEIGVETSVIDF